MVQGASNPKWMYGVRVPIQRGNAEKCNGDPTATEKRKD